MSQSKLIEWGTPVLSVLFVISLGLFTSGCGGGGSDSSSSSTDSGSSSSISDTIGSTTTLDPLSFMESEFAHKWSRYHAYDDSYRYFIFKDDRTACKFEITSSGSRVNQSDYTHWELDEDNPISTNIFEVATKSSATAALYPRGDEFHYAANELWIGGSSSLAMYPSTTTRDCQ